MDRPAMARIACAGVFGRLLGRYRERQVVRADHRHGVPVASRGQSDRWPMAMDQQGPSVVTEEAAADAFQ